MWTEDDFYGPEVYDCRDCDEKANLLTKCQRLYADILYQLFSYKEIDVVALEGLLEELSMNLEVRFPSRTLQVTRK